MAKQKWIQCVVDEETFERHDTKRKALGLTWRQYIIGPLEELLDTRTVAARKGPMMEDDSTTNEQVAALKARLRPISVSLELGAAGREVENDFCALPPPAAEEPAVKGPKKPKARKVKRSKV
jgi:hypothetical protein